MIILNDDRFSDEIFYKVYTKDDIKNSPNNSTIIFEFNEQNINLYKFCKSNNIDYAVKVNSITEFAFIINLDAKYALCDSLEFAKVLQKIADNYLTQTKIIINSSISEIENIILNEIDGIFVI